MTLSVHDEPDGLRVLRATGELDVRLAPPLLDDVAGLLAGARRVALDLSRATFFDSAGVRLVDRVLRACSAASAPVAVVAPPGTPARRVLELVHYTDLVVDDLDAARLATSETP